MSPAPISRRGLVVGAGAALTATALPVGVVEALAGEMPPAVDPAALPAAFDPRAFCHDLMDAGCRVTIVQAVWHGFDDDDLRPYYLVRSPAGRGLGDAYAAVLTRWRDAIEACPDHVDEVVRFALGQLETEA